MIKKILKFFGITASIVFIVFVVAVIVLPLPGQVPVLMYHFFGSNEEALQSKNYVGRESFKKQMALIQLLGYHVITLDDLYEIRTGKRKPEGREIAITFDDGNITFLTEAVPILKEYEFPVTQFLITESMKRGLNSSMSIGTIKLLLQYGWFHIGAHTRTHPLLSRLENEQIEDEVLGSKKELEAIFKVPVNHIAYPVGDFDARTLSAVGEAGYWMGFTTSPKKLNSFQPSLLSTPRIKISHTSDNPFIFWIKISGIYEFFKLRRHELKNLLR